MKFNKNDKLYNGIKNSSDFYFVHSYRMLPEKNNKNFATTNYGINFYHHLIMIIFLQLSFILKKAKAMVLSY